MNSTSFFGQFRRNFYCYVGGQLGQRLTAYRAARLIVNGRALFNVAPVRRVAAVNGFHVVFG